MDNLIYNRGNETAPLVIQKISRLQSAIQLANKSQRVTREMTDEARQIAKKALEMEAKAKKIERKVRVVYAKVKEKAMIAQEKERMCRCVLILSWLFFAIVMFLFCFGSIKHFGVKRLRLP